MARRIGSVALLAVLMVVGTTAEGASPGRVRLGKRRPARAGLLWGSPPNEEGIVPLLNYLDAQVRRVGSGRPRDRRARVARSVARDLGARSARMCERWGVPPQQQLLLLTAPRCRRQR